jgi:adenine deaminase
MLDDFIKVSSGKKPADLLLKGGRVVNVLSSEIIKTDIAVYKGKICGFGDYRAAETIDIKNRYILPGYIDGHIHIESSMLTVSEFANAVVPMGTTSVVADPHEIANVLGLSGIKYMLESAKYQPLEVYLMMPSCVPATNLETSGAVITAGDIFPYLSEKWVVGLGEMMNFTGVIGGDKKVLDKIKMVSSKKIDGHAPGLSGKALSAYISAGISSDHESTTYDEAAEKLRKGMHIMIREGTATKNFDALIDLVNPSNSSNFSFVSDDRSPEDLISQGHINYIVKRAHKAGVDPVIAVKMATLNTARYFNLDGKGAIAPGYDADLQVLKSFRSLTPLMVFKKGKLVAENGKLKKRTAKPKDIHIRGSVNVKWLVEDDFKVKARGKKVKTIKLVPSQIVTEYKKYKTPAAKGMLVSDTSRDMLKICVVERHRASGNIGVGMLKGMGLKSGAIATSVAHDSHNIVATGINDKDIMESLDLPIAGLMSELPILQVRDKLIALKKKAKELGAVPDDPFFTLSFLCLPVIPSLKLTDKGLVDVDKFKIVGLFN